MGIFAAGVLFGTAGIKILSSKDAKKAYTHGTTAALRAKDFCMKTVAAVQENAEDIYAEAVHINEERARAKKQELVGKNEGALMAYEAAHENAQKMRQMHDKLVNDINTLKGRRDRSEERRVGKECGS